MSSSNKNGILEVRASQNTTATVIFSHGLGDTAEGWQDQAENWAHHLPWIKFLLPTAPIQPVTWNGGMRMNSWYDIVGLSDRDSERCEGIEESVQAINKIIDGEIAQGLSPSRIVVGGFSQGGALSFHVGLRHEQPLGGVIALSGYLACASKLALSTAGKNTPVFQGHGDRDPLIHLQMAEKSRDGIKAKSHTGSYKFQVYKGMAHSSCPQEMADVVSFLSEILPQPKKEPKDMSVKELKAALLAKGLDPAKFLYKQEMIEALLPHSDS